MNELRKLAKLTNFYARQAWAYRFDALTEVVTTVIGLTLILYFWSLIGNVGALESNSQRIGYFLLVDAMIRLTTGRSYSHVGKLSKLVSSGQLTSMLMIPVDMYRHVVALSVGREVTSKITALTEIVCGLVVLNVLPSQLPMMLLLSAVMIVNGYYFTRMVCSVVFVTVESDGLRMALSFIGRLLSGGFVPLSLAPGIWRPLLEYSPFSYHGYWLPTVVAETDSRYVTVLLIGVMWSFILRWMSGKLFNLGLAKAEVVGL